MVDQDQTPQKPWTKRDALAPPGRQVQTAQVTRAGIQQPDEPALDAWRMRHRKAFADDPILGDVDQNAAVRAVLPPPIDHVGRRAGRHIADLTIVHCQAIQVTAVLGRQLGDKARLPERFESVRHARRGQAGILGVRKDDPARGLDDELVDVESPGKLRVARNIETIEPAIRELVGL